MVTLKEAIKLTKLDDGDMCYIRKKGGSRYNGEWIEIKTIREKYDMKNTNVISITPRLSEFDYRGIEFEIL